MAGTNPLPAGSPEICPGLWPVNLIRGLATTADVPPLSVLGAESLLSRAWLSASSEIRTARRNPPQSKPPLWNRTCAFMRELGSPLRCIFSRECAGRRPKCEPRKRYSAYVALTER